MTLVRVFGMGNVEVGMAEEYNDHARFDVPTDMVLVSVERTGRDRCWLDPPIHAHAGDTIRFTFKQTAG